MFNRKLMVELQQQVTSKRFQAERQQCHALPLRISIIKTKITNQRLGNCIRGHRDDRHTMTGSLRWIEQQIKTTVKGVERTAPTWDALALCPASLQVCFAQLVCGASFVELPPGWHRPISLSTLPIQVRYASSNRSLEMRHPSNSPHHCSPPTY